MTRKVIIVGGDHHNGLGLARIFGVNGIEVHSIVINDCQYSFIAKSKYIKVSHVFSNEKDAFNYILNIYSNERYKPIIIPYSDKAAFELDSRLDEFNKKYYVPSINNKKGEIAKLMDKGNQYKFAEENKIKMAFTKVISLEIDYFNIDTELKFPCILKPVISAEGDKKDIFVCSDLKQAISEMEKLKSKGYKRILVQEYLNIDYEIDVFGCVCKNYPYISFIPTKTIRSWPPRGGTNSYSKIITDMKVLKKCKEIIMKLEKLGFYGLYDIEIFVVNNEIVLNEINFRNSGDVYMALDQKYYYPIIWLNDILKISNANMADHPDKSSFAMTEFADLRNVVYEKYSFIKWIIDYHKTKDYALRFKGDMKPLLSRSLYYLQKFIKRMIKPIRQARYQNGTY